MEKSKAVNLAKCACSSLRGFSKHVYVYEEEGGELSRMEGCGKPTYGLTNLEERRHAIVTLPVSFQSVLITAEDLFSIQLKNVQI